MTPLDLEDRVSKLETDMEAIQATLAQVAQLQVQNQQQLNTLGQRVDNMSQTMDAFGRRVDAASQTVEALGRRVDSFVYEAQRLFTRIGGTAEKNEAAIDSLHDAVGRLTRNADADRNESRAFRTEMQSLTSRLDALVNYLMKNTPEQ